MADPANVVYKDDISRLLNKKISVVLSSEKDVLSFIEKFYVRTSLVEAAAEEEVQEIREEVAKEFKDIIDNATTVDYKDLYIQLGYEQGYERAKKENNNE